MRKIALALAFLLPGASALACTEDELRAKADALIEGVIELAARDPEAAQAWGERADALITEREAATPEEACAEFDALLEELEAAS